MQENGNNKMRRGSLGTPSSDVFVEHFLGDNKCNPINLDATISLPTINHKPTGYFKHHPDYHAPGFVSGSDFIYNPVITSSGTAKIRSSQASFEIPASDLFHEGILSPVYHIEDTKIQGWRDTCEVGKPVSFERENKPAKLFEGGERLADFPDGHSKLDKYVKPFFYEGPLNDVGKNLSRNRNATDDFLRSFVYNEARTGYNPEIADFIGYLNGKLGSGKIDINYIGVEDTKEAHAKIYKNGILTFNTKFHKEMAKSAKRNGLDSPEAIEAFKMFAFYHELTHAFQEWGGKTEAEIESEVGYLLSEYFGNIADKNRGTKKGAIYNALSKDNLIYALMFEKGNSKGLSKSGLEAKLSAIESKGKSLGLKGKALSNYVSMKLEESLGKESSKDGLERKLSSAKSSGNSRSNKSYLKSGAADDYDSDGKESADYSNNKMGSKEERDNSGAEDGEGQDGEVAESSTGEEEQAA